MKKQICTRCVMDNTSDETIIFKENGTCNYCNYALSRKDQVYFPNSMGNKKLKEMISLLKKEGKGKKYDCLMGISGGLDSAYLAYLGAEKWGLRILAVHIDDGFNTDVAAQNIEKLCNKYNNIDLVIEKPNEKQYMDIIKSFFRAGVPSLALPQDNVLQAYLNMYAKKFNLKYFLSGANFALESILQRGNAHIAADKVHIQDIHKKFGEIPLTSLPLITIFERYIGQRYISGIKTLRPLDYIEYNRKNAIQELSKNVGFNYYGGKHYESIFTKFVQVYYLPNKFNVDKRNSHYSSLIISNQMSRDEALIELEKPLFEEEQMEKDIVLILDKIGMNKDEFERLMKEKGRSHSDYKVSALIKYKNIARKFRRILGE
ncbi:MULTISPECIES: N-acetyl sugar amidotransferase [Lysinibacillus]|uniref:N-acetyl sugar amidotransferase n=1 Tax=Lysinibacillus TaxID=400634 RepID=UPI000653C2A7|nr:MULTISPECIES: N-acetyl sugar amidotransferase [Lysinibacillus]KMN40698.1 hypothetical protein VK91_06055 [Lysinibacillus sp. LK3]MED4553644.1 N-acetyl sugar amidotransferase [Lysinibacillus capsici]